MKNFKIRVSVHRELHWPEAGIKYIENSYQSLEIGDFI